MIGTILLVFALVLAILAAVGVPGGRFNLIGAALAFFFASLLLPSLN